MAKIHFLGTCSGTEPFPEMHHCSLVFEVNDHLYWFDGGEGCGYTAHTMGLNVLKTRALFVSHPHPDHICGLPHLFMVMTKLCRRQKTTLCYNDNTLDVFFPGLDRFEGIKKMYVGNNTEARLFRFALSEHEMHDGLVFEDENVRVSAVHNRHMKEDGSNGWHAFSFLIEACGKRIVFSGDVKTSDELDPFVSGGCDLLIHETGHHQIEDVCRYAIDRKVGRLFFNHHGRAIIEDREGSQAIVAGFAEESGIPMKILSDKDVFEF